MRKYINYHIYVNNNTIKYMKQKMTEWKGK